MNPMNWILRMNYPFSLSLLLLLHTTVCILLLNKPVTGQNRPNDRRNSVAKSGHGSRKVREKSSDQEVLSTGSVGNSICPNQCNCAGMSVKCFVAQLIKVPVVSYQTVVLDLRFNLIDNIERGTFAGLNKLTTLILNNNNIVKLDAYVFEGLEQLIYLYLYNNKISVIHPMTFRGLINLQQLHLHHNLISELHKETFNNLPNLERLFLQHNILQNVPMLSNSTLLRKLDLDSNPITCDCHMIWMKEWLDQIEASGGSLKISFKCSIPSEYSAISPIEVVSMLVCSPPKLVIIPRDTEITLGNRVTLQCSAKGSPPPFIKWFHNNKMVVGNERLHIASSYEQDQSKSETIDGSLFIADADQSDKGIYECVANNSMGQIRSSPIQLKTLDVSNPVRPRIVVKPIDQTSAENGHVTFLCNAVGNPRPEIKWTRNDLTLPLDPRFTIDQLGSLTLTHLQGTDQGLYRCVASNELGSVSEFARVSVFTPPVFLKRPVDQRAVEDFSVFFSCDVTADPPAKIRWNKNGQEILNDGHVSINPSGTTLTLFQVLKQDEGIYECVAENFGGKISDSARLSVVVKAEPVFSRLPQNVTSYPGGRAEFHCELGAGNPQPNIRWQREGNPVQLTSSNKYGVTEGGDRLIILEVIHTDEGLYECIAENLAGFARATASLIVRDPRFSPITNQHIDRTVGSVQARIDNALSNTQREIHEVRAQSNNASELLRINRYPNARALSLSRATEVFEESLAKLMADVHRGVHYNITSAGNRTYQEFLTANQLTLISSLSGCTEHRRIVVQCEDLCFHQRYRSFDGTCNNFHRTMSGSSLSPLSRILAPRYENNFNSPVGWDSNRLYNGHPLPSARKVSLYFISTSKITPDLQHTHMLMQWGQFLDHDMDFVPTAISNARYSDGRFCNETCNNQAPCFPILVEKSDPRIKERRCIGFVRSSAMCGTGVTSAFAAEVTHRNQVNLLTSFIDASNVYGSSEEDAFNLRDNTDETGLLREGIVSPHSVGAGGSSFGSEGLTSGNFLSRGAGGILRGERRSMKTYLPSNRGEFIDCQVDPNAAHVPCFQTGDHRANEQLGLLSMHTLWFREHNRLARKLKRMNTHWGGDAVYHETRKMIGAFMQHITYKHWLPKIVGRQGMLQLGEYRSYNASINPSVSNEFATAAFRFGHLLINPVLARIGTDMKPIPEGDLPLHKAFFAPHRLVEEGGIDPLLRGLFVKPAKRPIPGQFLNSELTEKLFSSANQIAIDLAAFNIQRARDHGLRSYNDYREWCGLSRARSFRDFDREIRDVEVRDKMERLYGHPDNVDLFVGGIAEDPLEEAKIGPTFVCILVDQFKRLRDGDRFWYENPDTFNAGQLAEIRRISLARVICDSSDNIKRVQKDVFLLANQQDGGYLDCQSEEDIPRIDLKVWSQCCQDCSRSGDFSSINQASSRNRRSLDDYHHRPNHKYQASFNEKNPIKEQKIDNEDDLVLNNNKFIDENDIENLFPLDINQSHDNKSFSNYKLYENNNDDDDESLKKRKKSLDVVVRKKIIKRALNEKDMMEEMKVMTDKVMDQMENRIEGMEQVVAKLHNTLNKLTIKMNELEKLMMFNNNNKKPPYIQQRRPSFTSSNSVLNTRFYNHYAPTTKNWLTNNFHPTRNYGSTNYFSPTKNYRHTTMNYQRTSNMAYHSLVNNLWRTTMKNLDFRRNSQSFNNNIHNNKNKQTFFNKDIYKNKMENYSGMHSNKMGANDMYKTKVISNIFFDTSKEINVITNRNKMDKIDKNKNKMDETDMKKSIIDSNDRFKNKIKASNIEKGKKEEIDMYKIKLEKNYMTSKNMEANDMYKKQLLIDSSEIHCLDNNGDAKQDGEMWMEGTCNKCSCQGSEVECVDLEC